MASESLQQLTKREPEVRSRQELNVGGLTLLIVALTTTGVGAAFLVLSNALGVFLLLFGLLAMLAIAGGAGGAIGGKRLGVGRVRAGTHGDEEIRDEQENQKRRRGQED